MAAMFPLATFVHVTLCILAISEGMASTDNAAVCLENNGIIPAGANSTGADGIPQECNDIDVWGKWICYQQHSDFGKMISYHSGAIVGTMFFIMLLCGIWILCLQRCARIITWSTLAIEVCCGVAFSIYLFVKEVPEMGGTVLGVTLLASGIIAWKREAVKQCGLLLQHGAHCIQHNLSIVAVSFFLQLVVFTSLSLSCAGTDLFRKSCPNFVTQPEIFMISNNVLCRIPIT